MFSSDVENMNGGLTTSTTPMTMVTAKMYLKKLVASLKINFPIKIENTGTVNLITDRSPRGIIVTADRDAVVFEAEVKTKAKICHGFERQNRGFQPFCQRSFH